jgi:hypothetical protein
MRITGATIGAPNPPELASFYRKLLGWEGQILPEWAQLRSPDGGAGLLTLNFEIEPDYVRPTWPSVAGEPQIMTHLDIAVEDLDAAVAWALESGATLAEYQPQEYVRVMLDPAGHPFCLFVRTG